MAFGLDESIKNTFVSCIAGQLNYHPFQQISTPSSYESSEHRLVLDALAHSIVREGGLRLERRFGYPTLVVVEDEKPERFRALRKNLSEGSVDAQLSGVSNGYKWYEALELHLEFRVDRLWLIILPVLWIDSPAIEGVELLPSMQPMRLIELLSIENQAYTT